MKLSAGQCLRCFEPIVNSAEPVQIVHAVIRYASKDTVGHIDHEREDLEYRVAREKDSESAVKDFFPEKRTLIRRIGQELCFTSAVVQSDKKRTIVCRDRGSISLESVLMFQLCF